MPFCPNRPILDVAIDPTTTTSPIGYAAVGGFNANTPTTPGHIFRVVARPIAQRSPERQDRKPPGYPGRFDHCESEIRRNRSSPEPICGLYYTNDITAISPTWYRFDNGLPHAMIWDMQIDRGNTTLSVWTRSRGAYVWPLPSAPLLNLTNVVSRKTHGSAGTFDLDITSGQRH